MRDWHKADIKAAIERKGLTMAAIARANGVHTSLIRLAVRTDFPKPLIRARRIIAAALERKPHEIWPSLFDSEGRAHTESRRQASTRRLRGHVSGRVQRRPAA